MRNLYRQPLRSARIETLRHALETAGSVSRLAKLLDVRPERLHRWATGEEPIPLDMFLDVLDVIAHGPYVPHAGSAPRRSIASVKDASHGRMSARTDM
jgi:hypothetical protein